MKLPASDSHQTPTEDSPVSIFMYREGFQIFLVATSFNCCSNLTKGYFTANSRQSRLLTTMCSWHLQKYFCSSDLILTLRMMDRRCFWAKVLAISWGEIQRYICAISRCSSQEIFWRGESCIILGVYADLGLILLFGYNVCHVTVFSKKRATLDTKYEGKMLYYTEETLLDSTYSKW